MWEFRDDEDRRYWAMSREQERILCGGICRHCNERPMVDLHHKNGFYRPGVHPSRAPLADLEGLCKKCHLEAHGRSFLDVDCFIPKGNSWGMEFAKNGKPKKEKWCPILDIIDAVEVRENVLPMVLEGPGEYGSKSYDVWLARRERAIPDHLRVKNRVRSDGCIEKRYLTEGEEIELNIWLAKWSHDNGDAPWFANGHFEIGRGWVCPCGLQYHTREFLNSSGKRSEFLSEERILFLCGTVYEIWHKIGGRWWEHDGKRPVEVSCDEDYELRLVRLCSKGEKFA
jgi:hypothetical protein